MSAPFRRPRRRPIATETSTTAMSGMSKATSSRAATTAHTMIAPPTDTSIPAVMMMNVMPTPMSAIGATETRSGWMEFGERNAGVKAPSSAHKTAITPTSTNSCPVMAGGRIRLAVASTRSSRGFGRGVDRHRPNPSWVSGASESVDSSAASEASIASDASAASSSSPAAAARICTCVASGGRTPRPAGLHASRGSGRTFGALRRGRSS